MHCTLCFRRDSGDPVRPAHAEYISLCLVKISHGDRCRLPFSVDKWDGCTFSVNTVARGRALPGHLAMRVTRQQQWAFVSVPHLDCNVFELFIVLALFTSSGGHDQGWWGALLRRQEGAHGDALPGRAHQVPRRGKDRKNKGGGGGTGVGVGEVRSACFPEASRRDTDNHQLFKDRLFCGVFFVDVPWLLVPGSAGAEPMVLCIHDGWLTGPVALRGFLKAHLPHPRPSQV